MTCINTGICTFSYWFVFSQILSFKHKPFGTFRLFFKSGACFLIWFLENSKRASFIVENMYEKVPTCALWTVTFGEKTIFWIFFSFGSSYASQNNQILKTTFWNVYVDAPWKAKVENLNHKDLRSLSQFRSLTISCVTESFDKFVLMLTDRKDAK